jgi:hypothetical protein
MLRILALACAALLLADMSVLAETYRCRTLDGGQIFTDDPSLFPPGCESITDEGGRGTMNIIPAYKPPEDQLSSPGNTSDQLFALWQSRADALVSDYDEAQRQRYNAVIAKKQLIAIQRLEELKAEKRKMLTDLDGSPLDQNQRDTIRHTLARIPDS